jgi:uncharacterized lipoprotein YajG
MKPASAQRGRRGVTNASNDEFERELTSIVERAVENVSEKVDMVLKEQSSREAQETKPSV